MAKKEANNSGAANSNVVPLSSGTCTVEKCGKKSERMNFCAEHYTWFKEGLINKKGERPSDFDKKYQAYVSRKKAA